MKPGLSECKNAVIVPHIASASLWTRAGMATRGESTNGKPEQQQSRRKGYMQPTASSRSVVAGTGKPGIATSASSAGSAGGVAKPKAKARKPALGDITNRKAGGSSSSMASVGAKLSKWEQKLQKQKHSVLGSGGVSGGAQRAVGMTGQPPKRAPQTTTAPRASFR